MPGRPLDTDHGTVVAALAKALCTLHNAVGEALVTLLYGGCSVVLAVLERQLENAAGTAQAVQASVRVYESHVLREPAILLSK